MDLAATSLDAYALFIAPRETDAPRRFTAPRGASPPPSRRLPVGWLVAAFYGALLGAFMLGVTAAGAPLAVARCSALGLTAIVAAQGLLLSQASGSRLAVRLAQGLTTPALGLVAAGLGALARLLA